MSKGAHDLFFLLLILWDPIGTRTKRTRTIQLEENQGSTRRSFKALKSSRTTIKKNGNRTKKNINKQKKK